MTPVGGGETQQTAINQLQLPVRAHPPIKVSKPLTLQVSKWMKMNNNKPAVTVVMKRQTITDLWHVHGGFIFSSRGCCLKETLSDIATRNHAISVKRSSMY